MRKRYQKKRRSCPLCKPHKLGLEKRWTNKDLARLKEFEKEKQNPVDTAETEAF